MTTDKKVQEWKDENDRRHGWAFETSEDPVLHAVNEATRERREERAQRRTPRRVPREPASEDKIRQIYEGTPNQAMPGTLTPIPSPVSPHRELALHVASRMHRSSGAGEVEQVVQDAKRIEKYLRTGE